jgi:succinate dehydrogenase/fumarate reductase flavoprotein subunit
MVDTLSFDIVIIGSGIAGMTTAITAKKYGLSVLILEKETVFGGTTALSGGVLWIPNMSEGDTREKALTYMKDQTGNFYNAESVEAFIDTAPEAVKYFERETQVKFMPSIYPDYHPDAPGGVAIGRSFNTMPYDARNLGDELKRLKPPLKTITFMGMMFNSTNLELKHFFNFTRSPASAWFVVKRLAKHMTELLRYGRGVQLTSGNALVARLAKSCFDLGIEIRTSSPVLELIFEQDKVTGVVTDNVLYADEIHYKAKAIVLACGGFPHDKLRTSAIYKHETHLSPTPISNTGDGIRMAETAGGVMQNDYPQAAAWMPVSRVGESGVFPHLVDRYKPGVIMVNMEGKRFTNESNSYHDVGEAMITQSGSSAWLIADHTAIRKYGLGYVKPAPVPLFPYIKSGYLLKGETLTELAKSAGIEDITEAVLRYNKDAKNGEDPEFKRGSTAFNRYLGDASVKPNPCVAPLLKAPFYGVKLIMGDLGTFNGLKTSVQGHVLRDDGSIIEGLFAVGNDRASIMGGNYPGAGITLGPNLTFGYILGKYLGESHVVTPR